MTTATKWIGCATAATKWIGCATTTTTKGIGSTTIVYSGQSYGTRIGTERIGSIFIAAAAADGWRGCPSRNTRWIVETTTTTTFWHDDLFFYDGSRPLIGLIGWCSTGTKGFVRKGATGGCLLLLGLGWSGIGHHILLFAHFLQYFAIPTHVPVFHKAAYRFTGRLFKGGIVDSVAG